MTTTTLANNQSSPSAASSVKTNVATSRHLDLRKDRNATSDWDAILTEQLVTGRGVTMPSIVRDGAMAQSMDARARGARLAEMENAETARINNGPGRIAGANATESGETSSDSTSKARVGTDRGDWRHESATPSAARQELGGTTVRADRPASTNAHPAEMHKSGDAFRNGNVKPTTNGANAHAPKVEIPHPPSHAGGQVSVPAFSQQRLTDLTPQSLPHLTRVRPSTVQAAGNQQTDNLVRSPMQHIESASARDKRAELTSPKSKLAGTKGQHESPQSASFDRIAKLVKSARQGSTTIARVSLDPPALGKVQVRVQMVNDRVDIRLAAENSEAGKVLSSQTDALRTALHHQGVRLDGLEVVTSEHRDAHGGTTYERSDFASEPRTDNSARQRNGRRKGAAHESQSTSAQLREPAVSSQHPRKAMAIELKDRLDVLV